VSLRTQQFRLDAEGQLFDLETDPGQRTNVAAAHREVTEQLVQQAQQHGREMTEALRGSINRPFDVGYGPVTMLPARDGRPHGGVQRSNKAPNDSYFTHWTTTEDRMTWDVDVAAAGEYEVIITYTCPREAVGSRVELSAGGGAAVTGTVSESHDPPLRGEEFDRSSRGTESFVKEFRPLALGRLSLPSGKMTLTLRAVEVPGRLVGDVKDLILTRVK
jgi:hypothetical protein